MSNLSYLKRTAWLLAGWFVFVFAASAFHAFKTDAPARALGAAVIAPLIVFLTWYARSQGFRDFVLSLNPRTLTLMHTWRVAGYTFLVLYAYGILPGMFALPAGWGDIAIGATAPLVALRLANPKHRTGFILWQVLGMTDLVVAVTMGTMARVIHPEGVATGAMTVLPLSLIPTFAVPLLLMLHMIAIAQARRWPKQERASIPQQARPEAA
ncbi:MAG TPA: hypothetical protein VFK81_05930 [Terriglobales bacterium]|nr:hypothetical protein [Terriglobales bacterium]